MKNFEKFKTEKERFDEFFKICSSAMSCGSCKLSGNNRHGCSAECALAWLDLEAEDDKPMNCPFCGSECELHEIWDNEECKGVGFNVRCNKCEYRSPEAVKHDGSDAIAAHNRVCKAVAASKESEVTK